MSDKVFNRVLGIIAILFCVFLIAGATYAAFVVPNKAIPVSGCVTSKIQAANGYGKSVHVLELDNQYITTSARVYFAAIVDGCYEFNGPRGGTSYNSIMEKKE